MTGWPGSGRPAHADRPWQPPARSVLVGGLLLVGTLGLAAAGCLHSVGFSKSTPTSASLITVSPDTGGLKP